MGGGDGGARDNEEERVNKVARVAKMGKEEMKKAARMVEMEIEAMKEKETVEEARVAEMIFHGKWRRKR